MREEEEVVDDPDDPPAFPDADQDVEDLGLRDIPHEVGICPFVLSLSYK